MCALVTDLLNVLVDTNAKHQTLVNTLVDSLVGTLVDTLVDTL